MVVNAQRTTDEKHRPTTHARGHSSNVHASV